MPTDPTAGLAERVVAALTADGALEEGSYTVVLSRRKRAMVDTRDDGHHILRIVATSTPEKMVAFIRANRAVLEEHARHNREIAPQHPALRLADGEQFRVLGQPAALRLSPSPAPAVRGGAIVLGEADLDDRGAQAVVDWYRDFGLDWMQANAPALWSRISPGRPMPRLAVRDLGKRREGLFEPDEFRVTLHWRAFQADARLVQYALAHELAHAARPAGKPHGPGFWRCVEGALPDARALHKDFLAAMRKVWVGDLRDIA
jgi:predicted metal-dependent hydrolase